jgi:hypothetical protein
MEAFTIKSPADVLSFVGHTLGFWPRESLVCITLVDNHVGPHCALTCRNPEQRSATHKPSPDIWPTTPRPPASSSQVLDHGIFHKGRF